jgi:ATP-dependent exoDNAse (exonuclease V) beta subunit
VDPEERENLRLLWAALDGLPGGELDLLGPGLNATLDKLCALPDPAASSDFGVQLMTIHKSKGLEFEVVIVPDLEAEGKRSERTMISWLKRGLAASDSAGQASPLTEFLIAPIQAKGTDAGAAKKWVDSVKCEREKQELRRLLYVAATRAREELHLFARPRCRLNQASGEVTLANPTGLLATAWPALESEVEARFASWLQESGTGSSLELETLAAEAGSPTSAGNLLQMPSPEPQTKPTTVRRLPESYIAPEFPRSGASYAASHAGVGLPGHSPSQPLYSRTEGGMQSRLLGTAIHALMEQSSRLRHSMEPDEAAQALADSLPAITARLRGAGLPRATAERLAKEALSVARQASIHPVGAWILTPHPEAGTESRWTGLIETLEHGRPWNLRPDRVFFAPALQTLENPGPETQPGENQSSWWIIDYKTSHAAGADLNDASARQNFLSGHPDQHREQLTAYAQVLRGLRNLPQAGTPRIRTGIFYPRLHILDFWEP